jgi:acetyl-CoA carboxylase biotin carboxyl carrier protein
MGFGEVAEMNHFDDILKLLDAMAALPFESMEVTTADVTVRVNRGGSYVQATAPVPVRTEQSAPPAVEQELSQAAVSKAVAVPSPIIGVFYVSPSPDDEPFVNVGDQVRAGQTLCIVEAMKLMNEIPSPVSGTITKVLAAQGSEVEVGQTLFLIEVAEG